MQARLYAGFFIGKPMNLKSIGEGVRRTANAPAASVQASMLQFAIQVDLKSRCRRATFQE
jgi:hypothetical protein